VSADPAARPSVYLERPCARPARSLLLLLHGVGGSEHDLVTLAQDLPDHTLVVLPRAPRYLGGGRAAWFPVEYVRGEPKIDAVTAETSRASLADFIAKLQRPRGWHPNTRWWRVSARAAS
jgi:phospholipase/carboxylesterase